MPDPTPATCSYCPNPAVPGQRLCRLCAYDVSHPDEGPKEKGGQRQEEDLGECSWDGEGD